MHISVRLTPRGGRDAVDGWGVDAAGRAFLKARVSAAPTDGEANAALVVLIARVAGVAKSKVRIVGGQTARLKNVEIEGLAATEAEAAFGLPPA
ncbi:MAG TPA: DUF167 family protein [Caulobacteraceae bacterium]